ncbi:hypothetical protein ACQP1P_09550 [Dactylosporangium sp. CA-052675]|uniref:hypothetical protein n=1 Tax=Dactylosporangium sp. CA-052675 TaxID=3239927 RepID=UPI003D923A96
MPDFASPAASAARLADVGHLTEEGPATAGFLALRPHRRRPAAGLWVWTLVAARSSVWALVAARPHVRAPVAVRRRSRVLVAVRRGSRALVAVRRRSRALVAGRAVAALERRPWALEARRA